MAKTQDQVDAVMALLPPDGSEITYDAWKTAIAGKHPVAYFQATRQAKREGKVEFILAFRTDGKKVLTVKRVGAAAPAVPAPSVNPTPKG